MNRVLITVLAIALPCGSLMAQSPQSNSGTPPQTQSTAQPAAPSASTPANAGAAPASALLKPAAGSVLPAQLTKSVDAKKAKVGDEVVARITQDLRGNAGVVVLAKDTKIFGHVTQVQARSRDQKESQLAILFDHAVLKSGETIQMPMSIQAIIAPPSPADSSPSNPVRPPGGTPPAVGGRTGAMGGATPPAAITPPSAVGAPPDASGPTPAQPKITGTTQGVVGIENLKLAAAPDAKMGSVVSSEKNNVKLEEGVLLLLRVNK